MNLFEFYLLLFGVMIPNAVKGIWAIKYKLIGITIVCAIFSIYYDWKFGYNARFK